MLQISRRVVNEQLAKLLKSFPPDAQPHAQAIYKATLAEQIIEINPSEAVLGAACRDMARTSTCLPSAVELLEAIRGQEQRQR